MSGYRETPTIPAMASVSEAQYRAEVSRGTCPMNDERYEQRRADTLRRIRAVAEAKGGLR